MASFDLFRLRPLAELLPEVESPTEAVPFRRKAAYTAGSLLVVLAGTQLPLYGIDTSTAPHDPLYWFHTAYAANCGTIMAFGVSWNGLQKVLGSIAQAQEARRACSPSASRPDPPLQVHRQVPHAGVPLPSSSQDLEPDALTVEVVRVEQKASSLGRVLDEQRNQMQRLHAENPEEQIAIVDAQYMVHHAVPMLQGKVFVGGVIVIYLDEALRKGYGLLSGIPLCTAANVWLQGLHVALPLTRPRRSPDDEAAARFQANYSIDISYLSYAPILFQAMLLSCTYVFSEQLYMKFGGDKLVNLLGKWERSKSFGGFVPVSGIAYYITTPPTLADVARDPVHTCLYAALLLGRCAYVSTAWFVLRRYSKRYVARLVGAGVSVTPTQAYSIPVSRWNGRVAMVAFAVGLCVGALTLLAGFMRVTGSGTGIMLAVTGIYSFCLDARASSGIGAIGL
nr:protein transport protein Sec61 subunit alpha-like [Aegilops tauschii subsp. strangulata]